MVPGNIPSVEQKYKLHYLKTIMTNGIFIFSVISHHDEHQRQEEGDPVHVQQAIPQAW